MLKFFRVILALMLPWGGFPVLGVSILEQPSAPGATVALGQSVTLSVQAVAETGKPLYQWRLNGVNIPGATANSLTLESFQAQQGGRYEVLVAEPTRGVASVDLVSSQPVFLVPDLPVALLSDPLAYTSRLPFENPSGAFRADNTRATVQRRLGEPFHAGQAGGASVWLWWIAPQSGSVRFRTHGSAFDTVLAVYEVPNPDPSEPLPFSQLVPVVSNDNASPYKTSATAFNAVEGTHYFIAVDGVDASLGGTGRGTIVLSWDFDPPSLAFRLPEINAQPANTVGQEGSPISLKFNVDFGTAVRREIQWFRNGKPIEGAVGLQLPIDALTPAEVGRHFALIVTYDADNKPQTNQTEVVDVQIRNRSDGSDPELLAWDRYSSSRIQAGSGAAPAAGRAVLRGRPAGLARGVSGFQVFNTSLNTTEPGEPTLCAGIGGKSAWYSFEADDDGVLEVDTMGSEFDTVLAAFFDDGTGTDLFSGLRRLACNNDAASGVKFSRIGFRCEKGRIYTLAVDSADESAGVARLNYRLGPLLRLTAVPTSQTVVAGGSVVFGLQVEGYGTKEYVWERNSVPFLTNSSPSLTLSGVTAGDAGTYRVTVRNEIGEVDSSPGFTLTVLSPPTIADGPKDLTVTAGQSAGFAVVAAGAGPLTYQWLKGEVAIPGAVQATYVISSTVSGDAGVYSVRVSNGAGTVVSAPATLVVQVPPTVVSLSGNQTVNEGQPVTFTVDATGTAPLGFQWRKNGIDLPGATSASLVLSSAREEDAGQYSVRVSNAAGEVNLPAVTLTVVVPPTITEGPKDLTVKAGQPASWAVTASGTAPLTYQWLKGGVVIPGADQATYVISATVSGNAGAYSVRVSNGAGTVVSAPATLVVQVPPTVVSLSGNQTVNEGQPVTFTVDATGTAPLGFQWRKNGIDLSGATSASLVLSSTREEDAGQYSVRVSNIAGEAVSAEAALVVRVPAAITLPLADLSLDEGQSGSFRVAARGTPPLEYRWFRGEELIPGATTESLAIEMAGAADAGTYTVRVSNVAGSQTSSASLTVRLRPRIVAPPLRAVVKAGERAEFRVAVEGTAPFSFQWFFAGQPVQGATDPTLLIASAQPGNAGDYFVRVTNGAGQVESGPAALVVNESPLIAAGPQDRTVVSGELVTFEVSVQGTAPFAYQWRRNGQPVPGGNGASLTLPAVTPDDAGQYTVLVSNASGSVVSNPASLVVQVPPVVTAGPSSQVVVAGSAVSFSVTAEGTAPLRYRWTRNGEPVPGGDQNTLALGQAAVADAGEYVVTVSNVAGSVSTPPVTLTVNVPVSITQQPVAQQVVPEGRTVVLSVAAAGTGPLGYQWYRGGDALPGATGSSLNLGSVEIDDSGTYTVAVSNVVNRLVSQASVLTVLRSPAIETAPLPQAVEVGTAVTLSVVASGSAPLTYQWRREGTPIPGTGAATLRIASATAADAGLYSVVVSNPVGSVESAPVRVQVNTAQPIRAVMETPQVLEDGRLRVAFAGTPGRQYLVQQSVDFVNWVTVKTVVLGASGSGEYLSDSPASNFGIFRAVTPPGSVAGVQLNPPTLLAENRILLTFLGSPGLEYVVEESEDLTTWRAVGQSLADESGAGEFEVEIVPGAVRSYRVITPSTAAAVSLQTPVITPEGAVQLGVQAPAGRVLLLQESVDLLNWTTVRQLVVDPGGTAQVETPVDPAGLRWFRLVAAPGQP